MDIGSELLAYKQERIDGSLAVPISEQFGAKSGSQFYHGYMTAYQCLIKNRFSHPLPLLEMTDLIFTIAVLKTRLIQVYFLFGVCSI